jgi:predicted SAM-dependent methyltransferase
MKLHIGGVAVKEGWKILNIKAGPGVDFVGDISDLGQFPDESCSEIYASHVLEHVPQEKIVQTLAGIRRVLVPGGKLRVSVPDMDLLCHLFIDPRASSERKFHVMRMMFGGQTDAHDFHFIGFNERFLLAFLRQAQFSRAERVGDFGIFEDASSYAPYGYPISLNVVATR